MKIFNNPFRWHVEVHFVDNIRRHHLSWQIEVQGQTIQGSQNLETPLNATRVAGFTKELDPALYIISL